jgi:hypothetical protein
LEGVFGSLTPGADFALPGPLDRTSAIRACS